MSVKKEEAVSNRNSGVKMASNDANEIINDTGRGSETGVMSKHYDVQTYLYAGYAYLLLMGILQDGLFPK